MNIRLPLRPARRESGWAMLAVLVILLVVAGSSSSFIWFMNQLQARAGLRYRSASAAALAEAGIHRALAILESVAPDGSTPGRTWRPAAYTEALPAGPLEGRITLALADDLDGAILVTAIGEVAGVTRRLRARVYLASPALLVALYGSGSIRLHERPAATLIVPYGAGNSDWPWVSMAAGREILLTSATTSINDPSLALEVAPGPVDPLDGRTRSLRPGLARVMLARGADFKLSLHGRRVGVQQLRAMGVYLDGDVLYVATLPPPPEVDRIFYQARAAANTANAAANTAAGKYTGDVDLERKRDSLYSSDQFHRLVAYMASGTGRSRLQGVIYVRGALFLPQGKALHIAEGSLVLESAVYIGQGASLEITHSAATRTLPGLIVLDRGGLVVTQDASLRVHGLFYSSRAITVEPGARLDVVGAALGIDPESSVNFRGKVVIQYDPAVLGTPGLRTPIETRVVAWVAAWEELP